MIRKLCVFCGSSFGIRPDYAEAARALGELLAIESITLVYGGAKVGLMGTVADACLAAGGTVMGVIPKSLVDREIAHTGLTELHVVDSMHQRKAMMADLSDAFIALPGAHGTLEEYFEILTWAQLGLHRKACGLLNVCSYYDDLIRMCDKAVSEGFLRQEYREMILADTSPARLLEEMRKYEPPLVPKWIERATR